MSKKLWHVFSRNQHACSMSMDTSMCSDHRTKNVFAHSIATLVIIPMRARVGVTPDDIRPIPDTDDMRHRRVCNQRIMGSVPEVEAGEMTQRPSVDDCLQKLGGDPDRFRQILSDKDALLAKVCKYAKRRAAREKCSPWSIIGMIFGHGSGVSIAIYDLYRERTDDTGTEA